MLSSSRISQHLRDCDHHHRNFGLGLGLGLGFCSSRVELLSSFMAKPFSGATIGDYHHRLQRQRMLTSSTTDLGCLKQRKSPCEVPILTDYFSLQEDDHELPSNGLSSVKGGIVALGKFDALHIGHRELAIQASKVGTPFLLSFVGMAEVFGWEPRAPIVAECDRKRVLFSWTSHCGNVAPTEFQVEFSSVRHLTPRQFVEKLSKELGVRGVVAGENYRFGYKASGDASELVRLCEEYGMEACIINSVMDRNQDSRNMGSNDLKERGQVSSTRVRHALAQGEMKYVSELLGRQHRLILMVKDQEGFTYSNHSVSVPKSCLLNLPPKEGIYKKCCVLIGDEDPISCRVTIDTTHIYLELDEVGPCIHHVSSQDLPLLGIEFGDSGV
ncbi:hypothetical protein L1049_015959 [Liquidambar formosana]|uniref:FAD synthase n=1 Tax=Liquidambar formosana TaxID=63359 RepID=A0AAP0RYQ9_LIQFO